MGMLAFFLIVLGIFVWTSENNSNNSRNVWTRSFSKIEKKYIYSPFSTKSENQTVYLCCSFKLSFQIKMMLHNEENHTILTQVHTMSYWFHDHTLGVVNNTWFGFLDLFLYPFIGPATVIVYTILFASLAFVVYKIWRSMSYEELSNSYEIVMSFLSAGFAFCMLFVNLTWLVGQVVGSVCDILSAK